MSNEKSININSNQKTSDITINDLKYHELRLILSHLSVSQLFRCLTVCEKWYQIITDLLESQKVLSLNLNNINLFTNEELNQKCDDSKHLAIRSSVGRVIGRQNFLVAAFTTPSFRKIGHKFFNLFNFCPNIQSLDLTKYSLELSDIDILFKHCPQLQCLSITSDKTKWTDFLCAQVLGLKHFSLTLTTKTPIYGVHEKPSELLDNQNIIRLEDLKIIDPQINATTLNILICYLKIIGHKLKRFHLCPVNKISEFEALDIINSLSTGSEECQIKDINLNVFVSNELLKVISNSLRNIQTLYIYFNIESQTNDLLKKLKKLNQLYLNFNSNINAFTFEGLHSDSDHQFSSFLPKIPSTLNKLTIFDALLSLNVMIPMSECLPKLQELDLIYVMIETNGQNFWQMISMFKSLRKLTINATDITDEGIQQLIDSKSLEVLELVRYKGPNSALTLIDSMKVIDVFGQMARLRPKTWFDLRLDINVFDVNEGIKCLVPRNLRLFNIGYKK